jgi:putative transposase
VARSVDQGIKAMFLRGVSTRKVGEVLDALCGFRVSAGYVSQVTRELDALVKQYDNAPLDDGYAFLFIDGLSVKVRFELKVKRMILLVAYGIRRYGQRKLLSFRLVKSESHGNYLAFLENLKARGLKGDGLELIIMDGALGLWSAVEEVYPQITHQLCWVHKLRNVAKYCPVRLRQACVGEATQIMYAASPAKAASAFRRWRSQWQKLIPKAVSCLENDFGKLIPFLEFPVAFQKAIRTTNVIERCFREVRRRLKVMGYFPNSRSCRRVVVSLFEYFNSKWSRKVQYLKQVAQYYSQAA